ncbi:MAG: chitobiase/beta-hexosaminidase C-terminal domain-containing protein [Verrucomicrobia bacterium]|nr:chitobiase/beta-hexosaminidase C-terminal domain-containing protein [Verrucomicrobiota bacterium]
MTHSAPKFRIPLCAAVWLGLLGGPLDATARAELALVPWPKTVETKGGSLELTAKSRVVATDAALLPLANVLAAEILQTTGRQLAAVQGAAAPGDIVLQLDPQLKGEAYALEVSAERAVMTGANYAAAAWGSVTLLQALATEGGTLSLPQMAVADAPDYNLRSIQVCIKHQAHTLEQIKQTIEMCRLYKIRYWMPHMSMAQWWTALSQPFRDKPTGGIGREDGSLLSPAEMQDLVEYARVRGVAILPQFEAWHCYFYPEQVMRAMPDVFTPAVQERIKGELLQDTPEFWTAMDRLVGQLAELCKDSPYIHVGPMAGEVPGFGDTPPEQAYLKKYNLRYGPDYWAHLYLRFDELIKKHGKQSLAWEGVDQNAAQFVKLPKDAGFASYHYGYWSGGWSGPMMIADGYHVVNCTWDPMYIISGYPSRVYYEWNARMFRPTEIAPSPLLLGAILCNWEGPGSTEIAMFRDRAAPFGERTWNPGAGKPWEDFQRRFAHTDHLLDLLFCPVNATVTGLTVQEGSLRADPFFPDNRFADKLVVTLNPVLPGNTLRYTLDGKPPTADSPVCTEPMTLTRSALVWAKIFDAAGKEVAGEYKRQFSYQPVIVKVPADYRDQIGAQGQWVPATFHESLTVELGSAAKDGKILYRLNNPTAEEQPYTGPLTFAVTTTLFARVVDAGAQQLGEVLTRGFGDDGFRRNVLTDPAVEVTVSNTSAGDKKFITDGYADINSHWNGIGPAVWVKLMLPKAQKINKLEVCCWWGDGRAYRYNVEVSMTGKDGEWQPIVDMKQNAKPADGAYVHEFSPVEVQFIRINMFGNTTNGHNHLCEVRAFTAEK